MGIERIETSVSRLGNDEVYGNGIDGTVIIASSTSLARDMYYENLTVNSGISLNTNGYKVFVKNTLTINGTLGISSGTSVPAGTVIGTTPVAQSTTDSLGGNAAGATYTATQMSSSVLQTIEAIVGGGVFYTPADTYFPTIVKGGAGGGNGAAGTVTPAAAGSGAGAGSVGATGTLALRFVGQSGGPGAAGSPGTNGAAGSTPPAASAGIGGIGGGVVFIAAKYIAGSGSIVSQGQNAVAGGPAATGTGATSGSAGSPGAPTPGVAVAHHADNHAHYDYPGGHAAIHAPALPHGHNPHHVSALSEYHQHRWVHGNHIHHSSMWGHYDHGYMCPGGHGGNFAHTFGYGDNRPANPASSYYHINGLPHGVGHHGGHSAPHVHGDTGVIFPHCAWVDYDGKGHMFHNHGAWPRQHYDNHVHYSIHNASTIKHAGHIHAAGGAGGAGGTAGNPGTNGSTTAGTNGQSGGGGGIICVTDAAIPNTISTNTSGGSLAGVSAQPGTLITIINQ